MNETEKQRLRLLAARFDEWMGAINFAGRTRAEYLRTLGKFFDWLAENIPIKSIAEVQPAHLQQFQITIYNYEQPKRGHLSISAQRRYLAVVSKFFSWLVAEQILAYNPASGLQMPRMPKKLPQVLSHEEVMRLIESTSLNIPLQLRDRAILELYYSTGIRTGELLALKVYDVNLDTATLRIEHGKGNQARIVPLVESVLAVIKRYISEARVKFIKAANQSHLFVSSQSGGPLSDTDIRKLMKRAVDRAGLHKHIHAHMLRHSCATHLLKGKADIRQIQKLLGHRRLSSTEIYTRVETSDLREVLKRCHPREQKK